jgi:hypothetical protein
MKRDCPHCHRSMEGKFVRWVKLTKAAAFRSCPLCGGEIGFDLHGEEIAVRLLTIGVLIAVAYTGRQRPDGFLKPVVVGIIVLAIAYTFAYVLLRNKQRYRKP